MSLSRYSPSLCPPIGTAEVVPFPLAGEGARARWDAPEHDWPPGLDLRAGKEKLRREISQYLLDEVVFSHGNATGHQKQIGLEAIGDQFAQTLRFIGSDWQQDRLSARSLDLCR